MHVGFWGLRETLKKMLHQLDLEIAHAICRDLCVHHAIRPAAQVNRSSGERFVHGHQEIPCPENAALRAESLLHGFPERDADVFDCVMLVPVKITASMHL